jgi:hypothetical protein
MVDLFSYDITRGFVIILLSRLVDQIHPAIISTDHSWDFEKVQTIYPTLFADLIRDIKSSTISRHGSSGVFLKIFFNYKYIIIKNFQ